MCSPPQDFLDWHGDHLYTNFGAMYRELRTAGYFVDVLSRDLTQFDASNYAALLLVDAEEEYSKAEVAKLHADVARQGLSLLVFADWSSPRAAQLVEFSGRTRGRRSCYV